MFSCRVEGHIALDLPRANSLAVFVKSRWGGVICGALPCVITLWVGCWWDALLGQPLCSSKGAPAPCWALPISQSIPRTTSKIPPALEEAGAAGGLGSVAARAAAVPHPAAIPAGASGEEWVTCTGGVTAPRLLFYCLQEGLWVGAGWHGRGWSRRNLQCQAGSAERWLSGRDSMH